MNQFLEEQYKNLGISREVYEFGEKIEESLKERFAEIDARAEYNQMKVIKAMQENRVSAECFNMSSADMDIMILEGIRWKKCTHPVFRERMHWSDHRLPVEPMRLHSL